jgi:stage III sporulation protein AH
MYNFKKLKQKREVNYMMVFKRKQIIVLSLILMLVVAGYLQYSYNKSSDSISIKETGKLGEAVYVDNQDTTTAKGQSDVKSTDDQKAQTEPAASKKAIDYFSQTKMDKEVARSKDVDAMKQITSDVNASKDDKAKAYDKMMALVNDSEKEMRIEALIKEKGFNDAIALFGDDGSIDVVVETPSLSSAQTAQIADIVSRQANIDIGKVSVKNVF